MAKRKHSGTPPHAVKSNPSQHDKRHRLAYSDPKRFPTTSTSMPLIGGIATLCAAMSNFLDKRITFRLLIVIAGAMLVGGRRTTAIWFRCASVKDDWDRFYELL